MKYLGWLLAGALTLLAQTDARADGLPLFDAFRVFCVNTDARWDAVQAVAEKAGGKPLGPGAATLWPAPMATTGWTVTVDGHPMQVMAGASRSPYGHTRTADNSSCTINSAAAEEASVARIQEWAGVAPDRGWEAGDVIFYSYQQQGAARLPMPADKAAFAAVMEAGRSWTLAIHRLGRSGVSVQLMHLVRVSPAR